MSRAFLMGLTVVLVLLIVLWTSGSKGAVPVPPVKGAAAGPTLAELAETIPLLRGGAAVPPKPAAAMSPEARASLIGSQVRDLLLQQGVAPSQIASIVTSTVQVLLGEAKQVPPKPEPGLQMPYKLSPTDHIPVPADDDQSDGEQRLDPENDPRLKERMRQRGMPDPVKAPAKADAAPAVAADDDEDDSPREAAKINPENDKRLQEMMRKRGLLGNSS